jgi:hypothetical protein
VAINIGIDLLFNNCMSPGNEVVIVKNGTRICGSGGVLCTAPIVQNKCYFEVKVQQSGNRNSCVHFYFLFIRKNVLFCFNMILCLIRDLGSRFSFE